MQENAWKCMKVYEKEKIRKWGGSKKHVSADITSIKSEAFLATCVGGTLGGPREMYENVQKCMRMYGNVCKCTKMFENVWKCMNM